METSDIQAIKKLNTVLRQFYGSIRTTKGLLDGLSRYINEPPVSRLLNLMQDPEFVSVFKGVVKDMRRAGKEKTAHHLPISPEDQRISKYSASLSSDNPKDLPKKVWYDIQLHFGTLEQREESGTKIPPGAKALYLPPSRVTAPTDSFWCTAIPLGVIKLSQKLARMCKEAETHTSSNNHSLRATAIRKLCDAELEVREIMAVTGHG